MAAEIVKGSVVVDAGPSQEINVYYSDGTEEIEGLEEPLRELAYQLQSWARSTRNQSESMIERSSWNDKDNPFGHIEMAHAALVQNDLVGATAELVEGLTFDGCKWELGGKDGSVVADVFDQMAATQNLDDLVRKLGRELFACSQVIVALWWDKGTFKARGVTAKGNQRKTTKDVWYPSRITVLDPTKVVPVGMMAFGQERFAWRATSEEWEAFQAQMDAGPTDEIMRRFYLTKNKPTTRE